MLSPPKNVPIVDWARYIYVVLAAEVYNLALHPSPVLEQIAQIAKDSGRPDIEQACIKELVARELVGEPEVDEQDGWVEKIKLFGTPVI